MGVVKVGVLALDVIKVAKTETHEVVQTFPFERPDPRLREGVSFGHQPWRADTLDTGAAEQLIERGRKLCVAVVKKELGTDLLLIEPHHHVAALLLDPALIRVIRRRREEDLPSADMDKHETIDQSHTDWRDHRLREKVAGHERVHVQPDEPAPCRFLGPAAPIWRGRQPFLPVDATNRGSSDADPQFQ